MEEAVLVAEDLEEVVSVAEDLEEVVLVEEGLEEQMVVAVLEDEDLEEEHKVSSNMCTTVFAMKGNFTAQL